MKDQLAPLSNVQIYQIANQNVVQQEDVSTANSVFSEELVHILFAKIYKSVKPVNAIHYKAVKLVKLDIKELLVQL